jgi:hypothetical protein
MITIGGASQEHETTSSSSSLLLSSMSPVNYGMATVPILDDKNVAGASYTTPLNDIDKSAKPIATSYYYISPSMARGHALLLLGLPLTLQLVMQLGNPWNWMAVYDCVIVTGCSYLYLYIMVILDDFKLWPSPYSRTVVTRTKSSWLLPLPSRLSACWLPILMAVLTTVAVQQRYLIAWSHAFAYRYLGTKPSVAMTTAYWLVSTVALILAVVLYTWPHDNLDGNSSWLREYQEDGMQLLLALAGATLGKAFGMSWNFTPLPVLAVLGFSLWVATRLLRYLMVFLFVIHATGVVIFTYRFAGMEQSLVPLPIPSTRNHIAIQLPILRFAFAVIWSSSLIGLAAGLAIRSAGGYMGRVLAKVDATGVCLFLYTVMLSVLEIALLKRPIPANELTGIEVVEADEIQAEEMLYDHTTTILSSAVLAGLSFWMMRRKVISEWTGWPTVAMGVGKAVAVYMDAVIVAKNPSKQFGNGPAVFLRTLIGAALLIVVTLPRTYIEPVYIKIVSRRRFMTVGGPSTDIPTSIFRKMMVYAFIILPGMLALAIPYVLSPLTKVLNEQFRDDYIYSSRSPVPELVGASFGLYALFSLHMLNHCLPDGGGEAWKKICGLSFLLGMGLVFVAPTLGPAIDTTMNPYAAMSNYGSRLISRGMYRTGGWGILSTVVATLLAMSGPLELKERHATPGSKDKFLLFRTMVFSLLFGGGVAWFIVLQSMREADAVSLVIVLSSSLAIAFMGTVAAVFGYFLELSEFREAKQMIHLWLIIWAVLVVFCGFSELFSPEPVNGFAAGGWLSAFLMVSCITSLSVALSVKNRATKSQASRAAGNMMTTLSWAFAIVILYGKCGVAGLGAEYEVHKILGFPSSIVGTFLLSPILFLLEGESKSGRRSSVSKLGGPFDSKDASSMFSFTRLGKSNQWAPVFFGSALVLLLVSFYSITLRGAGFLSFFGGTVARTHNDLLDELYRGETDGSPQNLAKLAEKIVSHNAALIASAKLAGSSIWTATSIIGPIVHTMGFFASLPSLSLLYQKAIQSVPVSASSASLALPLNVIPIAFCRGIPSLQAVGIMSLIGGLVQAVNQRQTSRENMMRI